MLRVSEKSILIPIDLQMGFDDPVQPPRWNKDFDANCKALLDAWRRTELTIVHVKHDSVEPNSPLRPNRPGNAFRPGLGPTSQERVIGKDTNSAFIRTDLQETLLDLRPDTLVIFGLTSDMCVSTSARMASNLGWKVVVVQDACDCFQLSGPHGVIAAELSHQIHMATLAYEFCEVADTDSLLSTLAAIEQPKPNRH